ncbi:MAG: glycosyltransferase family 61 protein [Planctomycetota bacterium]
MLKRRAPSELILAATSKWRRRFVTLNFREMNSDQYAERFGATWETVIPGQSAVWPLPRRFGASEVHFEMLPAHWPAQGVLHAADALLVGRHGLAFSKDGIRLPWHNFHRLATAPPEVTRREWKRAKGNRLIGTVLSLMSEFSQKNYCHFLFDCLPRFELFRRSSFGNQEPDAIVVPGSASERRRQQLQRVGVPIDKIIWYDDHPGCCAESLLLTTFPGLPRCYPPWAIDFLRMHFLQSDPPPSSGGRRLFVSRKGFDRDIQNRDEIESIAKTMGFEIFQPHLHDDAPRIFSQAEIVVGGHGAGLADVAYCKPGTQVLELLADVHIYPYYYSIAASAGCEYSALIGQTPRDIGNTFATRYQGNFNIDAAEFSIALKDLCENVSGQKHGNTK